MKFICVIVLVIWVIQIVYCQDSIESSSLIACPPNQVWSKCGNLCEHSCKNICIGDKSIPNSVFQPPYTNCIPGCYCKNGYIRTSAGCVLQKYNTCGARNYILLPLSFQQNKRFFFVIAKRRCGPNAIHKRCVKVFPPACFQRTVFMQLGGYTSTCVCRTGYKLNLAGNCVAANSPACIAENSSFSNLWYIPSACY
jgi:hypothetical protein